MQTDIALLFARNPLEVPYTDEELRAVVAEFRAARHKFAAAPAKPVKKSADKNVALLDDLGLDLDL